MRTQDATRMVWTALFCITVVAAEAVTARTAGEVLDELSTALKEEGPGDRKRALLAEIAKIDSVAALDIAIEAATDKGVAKEALVAAGQIAQSLMDARQPPYIRRSAFVRWVACQPEGQLAGILIGALRSSDFVTQSAAISVLNEQHSNDLLKAVIAELSSFHPDAREGLFGTLAGWGDASPLPLLLGIARTADTAKERVLALRTIAALAPGATSAESQTALLDAMRLATDNTSGKKMTEDVVAVAVQLAQGLLATRSDDVRRELDKLAAGNLSEPARQRVQGALLLFTIDQLPNLAKNGKASSPDGFDTEGGSSGDAAAIDGNPATYWDETDGHPLYTLRVDLPQVSDVSAISVAGWGHHSFSPKDFKIVCDGKTVRTVTEATYADNRLIVPFTQTRCTSVELHITGYYGGSPAIREFGIYKME